MYFSLHILLLTLKKVLKIIVLFSALMNYKQYQEGNKRLNFYSNKIILCGNKGYHYLILDKIVMQ